VRGDPDECRAGRFGYRQVCGPSQTALGVLKLTGSLCQRLLTRMLRPTDYSAGDLHKQCSSLSALLIPKLVLPFLGICVSLRAKYDKISLSLKRAFLCTTYWIIIHVDGAYVDCEARSRGIVRKWL